MAMHYPKTKGNVEDKKRERDLRAAVASNNQKDQVPAKIVER